MTQKTKSTVLLFFVIALGALFLLASSLSNLELQPGTAFPGGAGSESAVAEAGAAPQLGSYSIPLLRGLFALAFLILMIYVPTRMILLVDRKVIVRLVLVMIVILVVVAILPRVTLTPTGYSINEFTEINPPPVFNYPVMPLGQPPQTLIWLVLVGIGLGAGFLLFKLVERSPATDSLEAEMLQEAEEAVQALNAGSNLRNVIVRCYLQMALILQEKQSVQRSASMTVREFEDQLDALGFPGGAVHQLTHVFEKVRYGNQPAAPQDEAIALDSLNEIIRFCRQAGG